MPSALITIEEARTRVLAATRPLAAERVPIVDALDRVLATDVTATHDVPPFDSAAMDGYAVLPGPAGRRLRIVGESRAGAPAQRQVGQGEAVRISTGAAVPEGTAVIPQELVQALEREIVTGEPVSSRQHVRLAGEVIRRGAVVLRRGTRLRAAEMCAAVTAGAGEVLVARRPRVQVLSTGDELRDPGEPLAPGEIHNSNAPMLAALAIGSGANALAPLRLPDDRVATEAGLEAALAAAEVVIVSGGVSVGPHDHVKAALATLGVREVFWGVSLQPGKPTWFGIRGETLVFGLPGNPVSAAVTFALFAQPAILALQGVEVPPWNDHAVLGERVRRSRQRAQALRVRLERGEHGLVAIPNGPQESHAITSLLGADALALIPAGEGALEAGARVRLVPLAR